MEVTSLYSIPEKSYNRKIPRISIMKRFAFVIPFYRASQQLYSSFAVIREIGTGGIKLFVNSQMSRTDDRVSRDEYDKLARELEVYLSFCFITPHLHSPLM